MCNNFSYIVLKNIDRACAWVCVWHRVVCAGDSVVGTVTCPSLQSSPPSCHRGAVCLLITCTAIKGVSEEVSEGGAWGETSDRQRQGASEA